MHLHTYVHSSTTHNSRKGEATQVATDRSIEKHNVVHTCSGTLLILKEEGNSDSRYNMDGP